ncbi:MAG TPA: KTSC domain-containing protein [Thermoanaerobaculia bacterium]|jgi:hypothetical protein
MERVHVGSSAIAAIGYDLDSRVLEVEFRSRRIYRYAGVPPEAVEALLTANSIGSYFNRRIKPRYRMARLRKPSARTP